MLVPATRNGAFVTYKMPKSGNSGFATLEIPAGKKPGLDAEIHRYPAYVHARTRVEGGQLFDLNDEPDVESAVNAGGYEALMYVDFTGEGWVDIKVPQLTGQPGVMPDSRPAYVLLSAPDFFPSAGQRELSAWATSAS